LIGRVGAAAGANGDHSGLSDAKTIYGNGLNDVNILAMHSISYTAMTVQFLLAPTITFNRLDLKVKTSF
jgi:hypothetical protein